MDSENGEARRPVVAIVQSCYVPWKGFFDLIKRVDEFVIYDDVQFVKRHWHNRNRIKTPQGPLWLTIPVNSKGKYLQTIEESTVSEKWAEKHWRSISLTYARAPYFSEYGPVLQKAYEAVDSMERLSDINYHFLRTVADLLDLQTRFSWSSEYVAEGRKTDRLLELCSALNARTYVSGPSAKSYFETEKFEAAGISVEWMDYDGYREYPQLHGGAFEPAVSIVDLLLNVGPEANRYMKPFPNWKRAGAAATAG